MLILKQTFFLQYIKYNLMELVWIAAVWIFRAEIWRTRGAAKFKARHWRLQLRLRLWFQLRRTGLLHDVATDELASQRSTLPLDQCYRVCVRHTDHVQRPNHNER